MKTESPKAVAAKFKKQLGSEAKDIVDGLVLRSTGARKAHWAAVLDELNGGAARKAPKAKTPKQHPSERWAEVKNAARVSATQFFYSAGKWTKQRFVDRDYVALKITTPAEKAAYAAAWSDVAKHAVAKPAKKPAAPKKSAPKPVGHHAVATSKKGAKKASSPKPSKAGATRPFTIVSLYPDPAAALKAPKKASRRIPPGKKAAPRAPRDDKQEMREFLGLDKSKGAPGSPGAKVWAWLEQHALTHDATLYSGAEWAKRGESVGRNSLFTIATEGPLYQLVNGMNDSPPARSALSAFTMMLKKLGLYYEQGHAWTLHFYPRA